MSLAAVLHMPLQQASLSAWRHSNCCYCKHPMDIAMVLLLLHPPVCCCRLCTLFACARRQLTATITCMTVKGLAAVPLMSSSPLLLRSSCTDGGLRKMTVFTLNLISSSGS